MDGNLGVSKRWPSQEAVVARLPHDFEWPLDGVEASRANDGLVVRAVDYAAYRDTVMDLSNFRIANKLKIPYNGFMGPSQRKVHAALANRSDDWARGALGWLNFYLVGVGSEYYWHHRYELLFPGEQLKMLSFAWMASALGILAMLGLRKEFEYHATMLQASAVQGFFGDSYTKEGRRAQLFMLRLASDELGMNRTDWPAQACDEPIYETLLANWRTPDAQSLVPDLLRACDRHTYQTGRESERRRLDFDEDLLLDRVPVEILLLFRLREWEGLSNPVLAHPLMEAPFHRLIQPQSLPPMEDLLHRVLRRARSDWDDYDHVLSLETMRPHALAAARSEMAKGA